jgi:hypothetical protein
MHSHACGGGALAGLNVVPRPGVRRPGRRHQTSAATPRRGALTPISIRAMLSERAYYGRKAMALQRLSTSSSQSQPSAGPFLMPSPPPPARFAVLRAPAPILEFSRLPVLPYHARVPRLFTAAPHCPPGRCRSTPLPTLHGRPRPLLVPCSSPVPRARFCPAGPTVAPHSHRAANLLLYQVEQATTSSSLVGRTSVRPLALLSSPCNTGIRGPLARCARIASSTMITNQATAIARGRRMAA